jgi:ribosomal protein S18 acetylase RimI-like enzyme
MSNIEINKIGIAELIQLQEIGRQTFSETFSAGNSEENMKNYLEEGFSEEKLSQELNDPNTAFYFATEDDVVIGYLKIERIYVLKDFHGKSVGQVLYNKAIDIAKEKKTKYVWLGVWEENPRAISFYKKNGFVEFDKHIFILGDDEQTDIMMKLIL